MTKKVVLDGASLTIADLVEVTLNDAEVSFDAKAMEKVVAARKVVDDLVAEGRPMYGINTGFGRFADVAIPENELNKLQVNLILSDVCGVGNPLPRHVVRGMLLMRANSLLNGYSGVRPVVVETILAMLNKKVHPIIPEKGSVGSSGDLCPLSHMVMPMLGLGDVEYRGNIVPAKKVLDEVGIAPIELRAKEGLALINGTQCMTSVAVHALYDAVILLKTADIVGAMTMESLRGIINAYDPRIQAVRRQPGQIQTASNLRRILEGSEYTTKQGELRMQDSYSVRCIPQIHGASRMAVDYVRSVTENEINAVTDNPIVLTDTGDVFSGGNFHGQPMAIAADTLGIAMAEIGDISERRIAKLVDPALNHGLPAFLVKVGGINCGFMIPQYVAAALVSENKVLAHPASVDSIPTSAGQEDHVSMGTIAARKAATIVDHVKSVLGIELLCAAQAYDLQDKRRMAKGTAPAYRAIREKVAMMEDDRVLNVDQNAAAELVGSGAILRAVESAVGALD